jgi:cell division protein FtsI (penicillin-binding protein 3)
MEDKKLYKEVKNSLLNRASIVYVFVVVFGVMIVGRTAWIMIVEGQDWREKAEKMSLRTESIEAVRGTIYSADGKFLAVSIPVYDIRLDLDTGVVDNETFSANIDNLALSLSRLFGDRSRSEYKNILLSARKDGNRYFLLKRNISIDELEQIRTFPILNRGRNRGGLIVVNKTRRELPYRNLAYRTIGWDREGTASDVGLEGAYSNILSGREGLRILQRIGSTNWVPVSDNYLVEPGNGHDLLTSIDAMIQDVAHDALMKQLLKHEAEEGCVVLMEVQTGYVKAIVNLQRTPQNTYEERFNYAIAHSSEPGSTFKLASLLAAFEDRVVDLTDSIATGNGITWFSGAKMEDSRKGGHGTITVQHAFEVSSNVAISTIINNYYKDKPHRFVKRIQDMSLHLPLGLEISGEGMPVIRNTSDPQWSRLSLPWMAIGYEVALTPMQTLAFFNAVANNGKMMKPLFVKEIRETGRTIQRFDPVVLNASIASRRSITKAQEMLVGVVENGSVSHLKNSVYQIAGNSSGYNKTDYKASFVGYFPADNPRYSMIVVISRPGKGVYYGSQIAAPVFREIADRVYATSLDIQPGNIFASAEPGETRVVSGNKKDIITTFKSLNYPVRNLANQEWVTASISGDSVNIKNKKIDRVSIPNVVGMSARDAVFILERMGLTVSLQGMGVVRRQSVPAGSPARNQTEITLNLNI